MYNYTPRLTAPKLVEFIASTPQGRRIIRVDFQFPDNARFYAFHETSTSRSPAYLFEKECHDLKQRAQSIIRSFEVQKDKIPFGE